MRFLPMFPLQIVVFPKETLNLHIFEPRYKQLIRQCDEEGHTFGIPAFINGKVMELGTEVLLKRIEKVYPDGKMDVNTIAKGIFKIIQYKKTVRGKLYGGANITDMSYNLEGEITKNIEIISLMRNFFKTLQIKKSLPEKSTVGLSFRVGHIIGLTLEQEYDLLSMLSESERQDFIIHHLNALLPVVRDSEELRKKAQMNGHFKNILPPQV